MHNETKIIGICGGSCSGKTTIANLLLNKFSNKASVISFDDYYERPKNLVGKKIIDWEDLRLYRLDKFHADLEKLRNGKNIVIKGKSRESYLAGINEKEIKPTSIIIVEGFLIFHNRKTRDLFDEKIYLDLPEGEIIRRRLARPELNGSDNNLSYLEKYLIPAHRETVFPQRKYANHIIDGASSIEKVASNIIDIVKPL